jgi:hypothetical protein
MATLLFRAVSGQSIFDVCLNCYGTLDLLYKLIKDNGISDANQLVSSGQSFSYDDQLTNDQGVSKQFIQSGTKLATDVSALGSVYYTIQGNPVRYTGPARPVIQNDPTVSVYSQVSSTFFTSGTDGTTVITVLDKDGASMIGNDIVQIEDEIKPLTPAQFQWNKATGVITLLGGLTIDNNQTLFIIYRQIVTA